MSDEVTVDFIKAQVAKGKKYTMVFLKVGPTRSQSEQEATDLQTAHLKYLFGLKQKGILVINGPVLDHETIRGVSIYNSANKDEVVALASADPAVKAGRLVVEAWSWFSIPGAMLP
jgi:uncharacterized protein